MKYTRDDVIVTKKQAEEAGLRVGDIVYLGNSPNECIYCAEHDDSDRKYALKSIRWDENYPFKSFIGEFECVIKMEEPKIKYVPYNLDDAYDRRELIGKIIADNQTNSTEEVITAFVRNNGKYECWLRLGDTKVDGEGLLNGYVFTSSGRPVGRKED